MSIITLTSDYGLKDHYVSAVKGVILSQLPSVTLVDISHEVPPYDLGHASFVVRNAFRHFPKGTVHIIDICSDSGIDAPHKVILYDDHYFICTDNGLLSLICDHQPEKNIELEVMQDSDYFTFAGRDLFAKVAVLLVEGKPIESLGKPRNELTELFRISPTIENEGNMIRGQVIFVDQYKNIFVNITEKMFREVGHGRAFHIIFRGNSLKKLSESYGDVSEGEALALFSTSGYLELAVNRGKGSGLLGMPIGETVRIEFE